MQASATGVHGSLPAVLRPRPLRDSNPALLAENQSEGQRKSLVHREDTEVVSAGCTGGCTRNQETGKPLPLEDLAAALVSLSAVDRAKLAAMLSDERADGTSR